MIISSTSSQLKSYLTDPLAADKSSLQKEQPFWKLSHRVDRILKAILRFVSSLLGFKRKKNLSAVSPQKSEHLYYVVQPTAEVSSNRTFAEIAARREARQQRRLERATLRAQRRQHKEQADTTPAQKN